MLSDFHISRLILFHFTCCTQFCNEIERCQSQKTLKYFSVLRPMKNDVIFEYVLWKNVWFCFIVTAWVYFSYKNEKLRFLKLSRYFKYFLIKKVMVSIWICPMEKCLICLFPIAWLHFSHKNLKFWSWKLLNYFNIF